MAEPFPPAPGLTLEELALRRFDKAATAGQTLPRDALLRAVQEIKPGDSVLVLIRAESGETTRVTGGKAFNTLEDTLMELERFRFHIYKSVVRR